MIIKQEYIDEAHITVYFQTSLHPRSPLQCVLELLWSLLLLEKNHFWASLDYRSKNTMHPGSFRRNVIKAQPLKVEDIKYLRTQFQYCAFAWTPRECRTTCCQKLPTRHPCEQLVMVPAFSHLQRSPKEYALR